MLKKLYSYEMVKIIKNLLRPLKHMLLGKTGIYAIIEEVKKLHGGADNVRVIFDVGAANGEYTAHFLKNFPYATVYCFEPVNESFEKLRKRVEKHKDRIRAYNFGFYNKNAELNFYVNPYHDASSFLDRGVPDSVKRTVPVVKLDEFVASHNIKKIDFMKIDVEGAEKEVIEGGERTFSSVVDTVSIEIAPQLKGYYNVDHIEVLKYLHDYKFGFSGVFEDYLFSKLLPKNTQMI